MTVDWDETCALCRKMCRRRLHHHQDIEDAVQESLIRVLKYQAKFDPRRGRWSTWVCKIAIRTCIDLYRSSTVRRLPVDDHRDVDNLARAKESEVEIDFKALRSLSAGDRNIIELHYFQGLTFSRIALLKDMPLGTVKSTLHRALSHLRRELLAA
ncbi:MAG: RNA polymerase sigma factor [Phycisphaerales bacterium]|nr:RNA polymerase sigma factor [Phycisphaerales bacterium]MCI0631541.1 RNA polymerase sigma factor [Phycisphaerales bacterium]